MSRTIWWDMHRRSGSEPFGANAASCITSQPHCDANVPPTSSAALEWAWRCGGGARRPNDNFSQEREPQERAIKPRAFQRDGRSPTASTRAYIESG